VTVVLQAADNDPWGYPDSFREPLHIIGGFEFGQIPGIHTRDQDVDPHISLAVSQHMRDLMEEREPQMIVGTVPQAQLNQGLGWCKPAGHTARPGTWQFRYEDHGDAASRADGHHPVSIHGCRR
jgi:hypothetical protein